MNPPEVGSPETHTGAPQIVRTIVRPAPANGDVKALKLKDAVRRWQQRSTREEGEIAAPTATAFQNTPPQGFPGPLLSEEPQTKQGKKTKAPGDLGRPSRVSTNDTSTTSLASAVHAAVESATVNSRPADFTGPLSFEEIMRLKGQQKKTTLTADDTPSQPTKQPRLAVSVPVAPPTRPLPTVTPKPLKPQVATNDSQLKPLPSKTSPPMMPTDGILLAVNETGPDPSISPQAAAVAALNTQVELSSATESLPAPSSSLEPRTPVEASHSVESSPLPVISSSSLIAPTTIPQPIQSAPQTQQPLNAAPPQPHGPASKAQSAVLVAQQPQPAVVAAQPPQPAVHPQPVIPAAKAQSLAPTAAKHHPLAPPAKLQPPLAPPAKAQPLAFAGKTQPAAKPQPPPKPTATKAQPVVIPAAKPHPLPVPSVVDTRHEEIKTEIEEVPLEEVSSVPTVSVAELSLEEFAAQLTSRLSKEEQAHLDNHVARICSPLVQSPVNCDELKEALNLVVENLLRHRPSLKGNNDRTKSS